MAVNIASLTVKAAEVRVRLVVPLRVASAVVACAASPANVALGVGQRRWLVWQARKDALSGRRRRRQTFLEWSQTAHNTGALFTPFTHPFALPCHFTRTPACASRLAPSLTRRILSSAGRGSVASSCFLRKSWQMQVRRRCAALSPIRPHHIWPSFPLVPSRDSTCVRRALCTSNSPHARPHALYAVSVPVSLSFSVLYLYLGVSVVRRSSFVVVCLCLCRVSCVCVSCVCVFCRVSLSMSSSLSLSVSL